jgi:hypothetical protein
MRAASAAAFPPALVTATPRRCSHRQPRARAGSPPGLTLLCMAVPGLRAAQDQRSFCVRPTHVSERPQDRHSPPARTAPAVQIPVRGVTTRPVMAIRWPCDRDIRRLSGLASGRRRWPQRSPFVTGSGKAPGHRRCVPGARGTPRRGDGCRSVACQDLWPRARSLSHAGAGRLNRPSHHHYTRAGASRRAGPCGPLAGGVSPCQRPAVPT